MAASKDRPLWSELPGSARSAIESLVGGRVTAAESCPGGFSPGFASRLLLNTGHRVFVKAMDADVWHKEAETYRTEARVAAALPPRIPAPRFLGVDDEGPWTILAFEDVDGAPPAQPWRPTELERVVVAVARLATYGTPSPVPLPDDHPRLGGWAALARAPACLARLPHHVPWAADELSSLIDFEREGLEAARGTSLVHFDLYPHNILLTPERVVFVDWPHARLGAPVIDLLSVLCSAAADGIDPEPLLTRYGTQLETDAGRITGVLAALAGFMLVGALTPMPPKLAPIADAKLHLGLGATSWLRRRLVACLS